MTTEPDHRAEPEATDDVLARLLHAAGRRQTPPPEAYQQTLEAATAALQTKLRRRRRHRLTAMAAAAAVLALAGGLLVNLLPQTPPTAVAQMQRIIGTAEIHDAGLDQWAMLHSESQLLSPGSRLRTGAGSRAGLWLEGDVSLRLAGSTEVTLVGAHEIELLAGKIYVDTGEADPEHAQIRVTTAAGTAWDIGTQFEVRFRGSEYRLRVREGQVILQQGEAQFSSGAGEQLSIDARGERHYSAVQRDDPEWRWIESVAPAPDVDGEPVSVLLDWVARETGRPIRFSDAVVESSASRTILHGNIRNLAPLEALAVMLATTDLDYTIDDNGTILIGSRTLQ